jgi:hypothetical protein
MTKNNSAEHYGSVIKFHPLYSGGLRFGAQLKNELLYPRSFVVLLRPLRTPSCKWNDYVKTDVKELKYAGGLCHTIKKRNSRLLWTCQWIQGFHKGRIICLTMYSSQVGSWSMVLVSRENADRVLLIRGTTFPNSSFTNHRTHRRFIATHCSVTKLWFKNIKKLHYC